jgi:hypothetical protein
MSLFILSLLAFAEWCSDPPFAGPEPLMRRQENVDTEVAELNAILGIGTDTPAWAELTEPIQPGRSLEPPSAGRGVGSSCDAVFALDPVVAHEISLLDQLVALGEPPVKKDLAQRLPSRPLPRRSYSRSSGCRRS